MPNTNRLTGRFFSVLISLSFAFLLPRGAVAANPADPMLNAAAPRFAAWPVVRGFTPVENILATPRMTGMDSGGGLTLCQISDTVYRADGTPAQGTLVILWNAFTTAAGQPVAAGSLSVDLGTSGQFNAGLAPNSGAAPAGTYYRVTYKLNDGTTTSEYWVVPATSTTTIGAIRSKLVPANQAAQFLTRDFADSHYMDLSDAQTVAGAKTFIASPTVPAPVNPTDAASKAYVDANQGTANLGSPPPIGNVTPNTGNFTTLTVQNSNGIPNPANYPQSDPCAQINAAIGALPAAGGTVDARGFAAGQTCNATLNASKPVSILFGAGAWTFNGNPGINITAPNVVLQCSASTILQASATVLRSGGAYPLIANTVDPANGGMHTADGSSVIGCELNGNGAGTFGIFAPNSYSMKIHGVHASNFTGADILILAGQDDIQNTVADSSAGDGFVLGYDGHVSGMSQANGNSADGWHIMAGGFVFDGPTGYRNGLYGMHFDGNQGGDWLASTTYLEPKIILPTSNNAGAYGFYTQKVGTTAATRPAQFCQTIGCLTRDGDVMWINVGALNAYSFGVPEVFVQGFNNINSPNISQSNFGNHAGDWDNILIEGSATAYSIANSVLGSKTRQSEVPSTPAHGVHLKFASITSLKDTQWEGGAYTSGPQVELGGVELENSYFTEIGFLDCLRSYGNCLTLVGSGETTINSLVAQDGGVSGDSTTYAMSLDGNTGYTVVNTLLVDDDRGTPYQSGISNAAAPANLVVKNRKYIGLASLDTGNTYVDEALGANGTVFYDVPAAAGYQWSVNKIGIAAINQFGLQLFSPASGSNSITVGAPSAAFTTYSMTLPTAPGAAGQCLASAGGGAAPMTWSTCSNVALGSPPPIGNVAPNTVNATALTYQNIPGVQYLVSRYAGIQAAINAAAGSGQVTGVVVDDRVAAYTGAGFNIPDSVTVQLAPVTYTISSTVTFNNGNNNVTAGILLQPGARLLGAGTSTNHGTILQPGNGLNADLISTSTVGTGTTNPQWWHWGEIGNLRLVGNGSNQTAGDCLKVENMGETARIHDIELSACYLNNFENIGYAATQSAISNITSNRAVTGAGMAFTNLAGVGMLNGFSGDCNQAALISANFNAAGTLEINGLKSEAESSICPAQVQDPVILVTTTSATVIGSVSVNGGYAFGTSQQTFVKSTGPGSLAFTMQNFYLLGYTNILNDTVRTQVIANTAGSAKQPVSYLGNGVVLGNQAFTFQGNTFIQGDPNGTPTELFGLTSSSSTLLADAGNGDNSSVLAGGIQIDGHNRTQFGSSPEIMARWGYRFLGPNNGYDTTKWDLVPAWNTGDTTEKNLGNPLTVCQKGGTMSCRWSNLYAQNVDTTSLTLNGSSLATVASSGSYNDLNNKPAIPTQGAHLIGGTMQGATATLTGNSSDQTIYSATLPTGSFNPGAGVHCYAKWTHPTASGAITYKWTLGTTTWGYGGYTSSSQNLSADVEILTIASLTSQSVNLSPVIAGTAIGIGGSYGNAGSENLSNTDTIKLTFNGGASDQVKGATFYCQTIQ